MLFRTLLIIPATHRAEEYDNFVETEYVQYIIGRIRRPLNSLSFQIFLARLFQLLYSVIFVFFLFYIIHVTYKENQWGYAVRA